MPYCLVSFGSNLGDRRQLIGRAARRLRDDARVQSLACSRLFETPSIGGPSGQHPFLNAVAVARTERRAGEMIARLQAIESELGRRRAQRWDARTIDLDVVLYGDWIGRDLRLTVPHPRFTARAFVLGPALDVAADWRDPRCGWPLERVHRHLHAAPPSLALAGGEEGDRQYLCERLRARHGVTVLPAPPTAAAAAPVGRAPAAGGWAPAPASEPEPPEGRRWVAPFLPAAVRRGDYDNPLAPRLIARLEWAPPESRWPAPHQIWQGGGSWPEYRLEVEDLDWAADELASALDSMQCPVRPVTDDGTWIDEAA